MLLPLSAGVFQLPTFRLREFCAVNLPSGVRLVGSRSSDGMSGLGADQKKTIIQVGTEFKPHEQEYRGATLAIESVMVLHPASSRRHGR
jgi:hypothetical protein